VDDSRIPHNQVSLNRTAHQLAELVAHDADRLRVQVHDNGVGVPLIDCGLRATGSLEAGLRVAEICLGGQAKVSLVPFAAEGVCETAVSVWTDRPLEACLASQYAGWRLADADFFAMGSGPMRALARQEKLFDELSYRESSDVAVGILETEKFPPPEVAQSIADACDVELRRLTLLVARTSSLVGTIQVVARSVETALHKLHELQFDLRRIVAGFGVAPLPPCGGSDLAAMGRTNDAILFGTSVTLWLTGDDSTIAAVMPQLPSNASRDYGRNFLDLFEAHGRDFYRIDPLLFSPAHIVINNLESGRRFEAGRRDMAVLRRSFCPSDG
jgi:methenyltetrahydromethanopterin cyclohydrolase